MNILISHTEKKVLGVGKKIHELRKLRKKM